MTFVSSEVHIVLMLFSAYPLQRTGVLIDWELDLYLSPHWLENARQDSKPLLTKL